MYNKKQQRELSWEVGDHCLTCDLADSEVFTHVAIQVPGSPLDAIGGARLQVGEGVVGAGGVEFDACVRALHDDAQAVEDSMLHWLPAHEDAAGAGRGGVQFRSFNHWREPNRKSEVWLTTGSTIGPFSLKHDHWEKHIDELPECTKNWLDLMGGECRYG